MPPTVISSDSPWRAVGAPLVPATGTGTLATLRIAVKDLLAVAGERVGAGNPTWLRSAPLETSHAAVVATLLGAGASVQGIAHTDELGYGIYGINAHYGTPVNPAAPGRVPGGSSSGSASAVALGQADIGLGTDTVGSIRVPASYCGLYGLRPTHGALPADGRRGLAPSFDTVGWLTRDPEVLRKVAEVLLPLRPPTPIRTLVLAADLLDLVPPRVRDALSDAARHGAERAGLPLQVVDTGLGAHVDAWAEALGIRQAVEMWETYGAWLEDNPGAASPPVAAAIAGGGAVPAEYDAWATTVLADARQTLARLLRDGVGLVQPASLGPAPPPGEAGIETTLGNAQLQCAASIAGVPVLTVPAAVLDDGPVGLSVLAARHSDRDLMALLPLGRPGTAGAGV